MKRNSITDAERERLQKGTWKARQPMTIKLFVWIVIETILVRLFVIAMKLNLNGGWLFSITSIAHNHKLAAAKAGGSPQGKTQELRPNPKGVKHG